MASSWIGLRVASLVVGESTEWVVGEVPGSLRGASFRSHLWEVADDTILLTVPTVGRFLITAGAPTVVEPEPVADGADVAAFVRRPVRAAAALLKGSFPLRGSAVDLGGRALVIIGPPGAGKSSLAASLTLRGFRLCADKVVVVDPDAERIVAGDRHVTLGVSAAEALGLPPKGRPIRRGTRVSRFSVPSSPSSASIGHIVHLHAFQKEADSATAAGRMRTLAASQWHTHLLPALGLTTAAFAFQAKLAEEIEMTCLPPGPESWDRLDALVDGASP